ncbi:MAG: HlyD family efflux transporter periplasmic adaptor subunit [Clostridia bacterium]|nr:HlyD family efflux transporter periplasmic adaptor subunit [Clostridia bacterium]
MKTIVGKIVKWIIILAVLAALGFGGYTLYQRYPKPAEQSDAAGEYTPVAVSLGSLSQEVISTGALSISESASVKAPFSVTIDSVAVKAGQTVAKGDVLATVDAASIDSAIAAVVTELEEADSSVVSLASAYTETQNIQNPAEGRVKIIYGKVGDRVQDVMDEYGCLYVLSLDGTMVVSVPAPEGLTTDSAVSVVSADKTWKGTVISVTDGVARVTFTDSTVSPGTNVSVTYNGASLGSGAAEIHMPLYVSSTMEGVITAARLTLNGTAAKKSIMYKVGDVQMTQEYEGYLTQRAELIDQLNLLRRLKDDPVITTNAAGIVSEVSAQAGQEVVKDDTLATLYIGSPNEMVISVDELDIINVKVGQTAGVQMDAISDKTYEAKVEYISQLGTTSSGITNYDVTVRLNGDDTLKMGMNGTVTIYVGEQENVLLVPLVALQSDSLGSYVWKYEEGYQGTDEAPGVKTYVTTGLSNENYAAVTSGLSLGDQVLVVRSSATAVSADASTGNGNAFGGAMMPTAGQPGGNMQQNWNGGGSGSGGQNRGNGGNGGNRAPGGN